MGVRGVEELVRLGGDEEASEFTDLLVVKDATGDDDDDGDVYGVECEGDSLLERMLYASHVTDWISIALALMNGVDPSQMDSIVGLKAHLSKVQ